MGMYDYFKSSYDLGPEFTNVSCQTKDIDDYGSGSMSDYWLDPKGRLWVSTYTDTHTLDMIKEEDPEYNPKLSFLNFKWIPTGKHGKLVHWKITKYIEVYPLDWKGKYEHQPRMRLHFRDGILQDFLRLNT